MACGFSYPAFGTGTVSIFPGIEGVTGRGYLNAVLGAFGIDVDYAQLVKHYGPTVDASGPERKYSPGECCGISKRALIGKPSKRNVSTSYVEKHNQTMRQSMKRFARLTAGHSKKIANHVHMVALYTTWYNFARINSSVRMSPAMACGLEQRLWDIGDIVKLRRRHESRRDFHPFRADAIRASFGTDRARATQII